MVIILSGIGMLMLGVSLSNQTNLDKQTGPIQTDPTSYESEFR